MISGFLRENCAVLRYRATISGKSYPTFRDNLSVPSSSLALRNGTCMSTRTVGKKLPLLTAYGTICCSEPSVRNYHCSLHMAVLGGWKSLNIWEQL